MVSNETERNLNELIVKYDVENKNLKPILENHKTGYTISVKSPFSNKTLIIRQDGKIISN